MGYMIGNCIGNLPMRKQARHTPADEEDSRIRAAVDTGLGWPVAARKTVAAAVAAAVGGTRSRHHTAAHTLTSHQGTVLLSL